jgi:hypothetical protein
VRHVAAGAREGRRVNALILRTDVGVTRRAVSHLLVGVRRVWDVARRASSRRRSARPGGVVDPRVRVALRARRVADFVRRMGGVAARALGMLRHGLRAQGLAVPVAALADGGGGQRGGVGIVTGEAGRVARMGPHLLGVAAHARLPRGRCGGVRRVALGAPFAVCAQCVRGALLLFVARSAFRRRADSLLVRLVALPTLGLRMAVHDRCEGSTRARLRLVVARDARLHGLSRRKSVATEAAHVPHRTVRVHGLGLVASLAPARSFDRWGETLRVAVLAEDALAAAVRSVPRGCAPIRPRFPLVFARGNGWAGLHEKGAHGARRRPHAAHGRGRFGGGIVAAAPMQDERAEHRERERQQPPSPRHLSGPTHGTGMQSKMPAYLSERPGVVIAPNAI